MALEPLAISAEPEANPELADMTPAVLGRPRARRAGGRAGNGRHAASAGSSTANWLQIRPGDAGRALGRLAVLPARLGIAAAPQPEHVHADRAGHRRGLALQRGRRRSRPACSRPASAPGRRRGGVFRGRGGHHRAGAARAGAGTAGARADRRRDPRAAQPGAEDRPPRSPLAATTRRSRSTRSIRATGCACARRGGAGGRRGARRAAAPSTSRWSPASRCRWRSSRATG